VARVTHGYGDEYVDASDQRVRRLVIRGQLSGARGAFAGVRSFALALELSSRARAPAIAAPR
jgi:hypothetical protein